MVETRLTADHLEHEIESRRGALRTTLDEVTSRLTGSDWTGTVHKAVTSVGEEIGQRLPDTVRRNPVPAAMIAAGAGWLVWSALRGRESHEPHPAGGTAFAFQRGQGPRAAEPARTDVHAPHGTAFAFQRGQGPRESEPARTDMADLPGLPRAKGGRHPALRADTHPRDPASDGGDDTRWGERLQDNASALRDWLAEGTENLSDAARQRIADARQHALDAQVKVERAARHARVHAARTFDGHPLLIGGIGFVTGLLAGALVPATRRENETIGASRDHMFDEAERVFREEAGKAASVAQAMAEEGRRVVGEALDKASARLSDDGQQKQQTCETVREAAERMAEAARKEAELQNTGKIG